MISWYFRLEIKLPPRTRSVHSRPVFYMGMVRTCPSWSGNAWRIVQPTGLQWRQGIVGAGGKRCRVRTARCIKVRCSSARIRVYRTAKDAYCFRLYVSIIETMLLWEKVINFVLSFQPYISCAIYRTSMKMIKKLSFAKYYPLRFPYHFVFVFFINALTRTV